MKYVLLIMNTPDVAALTEAEFGQWYGEISAWYEARIASGELAEAGYQLQPPATARTLRASGATDGPFMEAKEIIAGVSVLEAESLDAAAAIGQTWPGVERGLITLEIRPVMVM